MAALLRAVPPFFDFTTEKAGGSFNQKRSGFMHEATAKSVYCDVNT